MGEEGVVERKRREISNCIVVVSAGGQDTEASYPYTAKDGTCAFKEADIAASISGYKEVRFYY